MMIRIRIIVLGRHYDSFLLFSVIRDDDEAVQERNTDEDDDV